MGYRYKDEFIKTYKEVCWHMFFDKNNISCEYIKSDKPCTLPIKKEINFLLTDQDAFFIIIEKEQLNDIIAPLFELYNKYKMPIIIGFKDGSFRIIEREPGWGNDCFSCQDSVLFKCLECGKYWFGNNPGTWKCKCCGAYDGDHHIGEMVFGNDNKLWSGVF